MSVQSTPQETTPLLRKESDVPTQQQRGETVVWRVLFTAFIVSASFGVTQTARLIFAFGYMTCDEYYKTHPDPGAVADRCRHPEITAGVARAVALLGASTTVFGVVNLFLTGWWIKRFGVKSALLVSVFWPAVRLAIQNIGIETGAGLGIIIIQLSQIITIIGGPAGYLLSLNSFAAEVVKPAERTATLGRLSGCNMFGTALGFLVGGVLSDNLGIRAPFRITLVLFLSCCIFVILALPKVMVKLSAEGERRTRSIWAFFEPLRMFMPQRWVLVDGRIKREYGVLLLGSGAFLGVLATGYMLTLLQLFSIDTLDFNSTQNGWLLALNCSARGIFLTLIFPLIIYRGRQWLDQSTADEGKDAKQQPNASDQQPGPEELVPGPVEAAQELIEPPEPVSEEEQEEEEKEESFQFDLVFARWSIATDAVLTGAATFVTKGWQLYLVAVILPLASGTGPAAKGVMLQMCSPSQRSDALSAISLVEAVAKVSTIGVFGFVFSAFAQIGAPYLTFACNAAVALLAFAVLAFARFPPPGSKRLAESGEDCP